LRFEAAAQAQRDIDLLESLRRRQRQLAWVVTRQNFVVLVPAETREAAILYAVLGGRLAVEVRLTATADLIAAAALVRERFARYQDAPLGRADVDGTAIVAAWLRDRGAHEGAILAVGLHLVLVQGRPASAPGEIPRLLAAPGAFPDQPVLAGLRYAWLAVAQRGGRAELRHEIEAQLRAFEATGLRLAHVDGHVNIHLHPMILPLLLELAPRYGIRALRLSRESLGSAL